MEYTPDKWVIVDTGKTKKVFATFYGGYLNGQSWKLSSGTKEIIDDDVRWTLPQESGSVYHLYKNSEGMSRWSSGVLGGFIKNTPQLKVITIKDGQFVDEIT